MGTIKYSTSFILESRICPSKKEELAKNGIELKKLTPEEKSKFYIQNDVPIIASITFLGQRVFYPVAYRVDRKNWTNKSNGITIQQVTAKTINKGATASKINKKIKSIDRAIDDFFEDKLLSIVDERHFLFICNFQPGREVRYLT